MLLIVLVLFADQGGTITMEAKLAKMDDLPKTCVGTLDTLPVQVVLSPAAVHECPSPSATSGALPRSPSSPPSPSSIQFLDEFNSCSALLLPQKLRTPELQTRETETSDMSTSAPDPSCLPTPPSNPHIIDTVDLVEAYQNKWMKGDSESLSCSSGVDAHDEGK